MAVEIAADIRKGNIIEHTDGQLYVVLKAESFRPGKGTPTTTIDMRRISDGIKISNTYKTSDKVERAFVEEVEFSYLYQEGDNYIFMNTSNYDQVTVSGAMVGDGAAYLQENMNVTLQLFNGEPVSLSLPQRITAEVVETEPVVKGQTASGSYKPAKLDNGLRVMVPPHIGVGTRVIVNTDDGSYLERAKD
ncbi:MAG TPA: elongation factor P [Hyphomonas sp.]|nr:elongation factor P [Hyphomonas sp.]HRK69729.1 elongation factor P [Hyphomonas sp.]